MEKICVAVRVRPPVSLETSGGVFWKVEDNRVSLHRQHDTPVSGTSYAFDHVFEETCSNARVYELLTKDIIHAAVEGFNGTVFAYGQTSSGKTFTMNGSADNPGVISLGVKDIFDAIQMMSNREFLVRVSYMEIYNEEINDLLAVENQKLQIHESLEHGVFVAGLREEIVNSAEQVLKLIESGEVNRHFGETNMNVRSSRSHTIFRMVIESKGKDNDSSSTDAIRVSVLNLVDLAGSERIAKTGADGVRLKEGKHINKSLMALGNVINKLSDGVKQRGHIPYRDSKLTRILQPALGGNAKTSIICTIAPEEDHIEETKGTLQFASRAKRITNCVQVNEILTDAALLKRQKLEIEELRRKLQGSHAGVLEQEILKLRNDMLKYELEREKLQLELEEERRSRKERDQCVREQQMRLQNHNSLVTSSGGNGSHSEEQNSKRQSFCEECSDSNGICQGGAFRTPCSKAAPNAFVVKRSNYSRLPEYSPLPDTFSNVADEDTWLKMNKGYIADLDSLQMTPATKVQSFPLNDGTPGCSNENYRDVQKLKRQLENVTEEKNEFQRKYSEEKILNARLTGEISELRQEVLVIREIPRRLYESVVSSKDFYEDLLCSMKSFAADGESSTAKKLVSISEIGSSLFSTLETNFLMAMDGDKSFSNNDSLVREQCKVFCEKLKSTISALILSEKAPIDNKQGKNSPCSCNNKVVCASSLWLFLTYNISFRNEALTLLIAVKGCAQEEESTCWKEKLSSELNTIKEKYHGLEKDLDLNNKFLETSKEMYDSLEREFRLLQEERDSLLNKVSESSQTLTMVTDQKENVLKDYNTEVEKKKNLEEEIKQFSAAFACRQKSLVSFHSDLKSKIEKLRAQNPVSVPKSRG
ncbi:kinesin-like protein KIN-7N [Citrus sinensis]|uniref:Kinesin-like protein KIN-7N n=1 Tax=Citrus sinensis TaxID=2711 RepID=A0ACB8IPU9_CITSI|nr:kinesin-like protein KIN-7N [Citrus sinensis]